MKIIKPVTTLCNNILSYNVAQDVPLWSSTASYDKDAQVTLDACGTVVYQSVTSSNVGNDPSASIANWAEVGVSNYYALFDNKVDTQTVNANSIEIEIAVDTLVNSVALINLVASSVRFETWDEYGVKLFDETISLRDYGAVSMYDYYFSPILPLKNFVSFNIPTFFEGRGKMTLLNPLGDVKLGALVYGEQFYIGNSVYGLSLSIKDYSTKETDVFGNTSIVERAYKDVINATIQIHNVNIGSVKSILSDYRASAIVWVVDEDRDYGVTYGFYNDLRINLSHPAYADCTLKIESI